MMEINIENLNAYLLDILKELGNIGSGNAATALAKMINKKIDMKVPKAKVLEFRDVADVLGNEEAPMVGIYFQMSGDILGNMMFTLDIKSASSLLSMIFNKEEMDEKFDDMALSALAEIGNILTAAYINSLSNLTGLNIKISIPSVNIDMAGAILSVAAIQFGQIGDKVLLIETEFNENEKCVIGNIILIPELKSFNKMLEKLGVIEK